MVPGHLFIYPCPGHPPPGKVRIHFLPVSPLDEETGLWESPGGHSVGKLVGVNSKLLEGCMHEWVLQPVFHFFPGLLFLSKPFCLTLYHKRALLICSVSQCLCFKKTLFLEKKKSKRKKIFCICCAVNESQQKRRTNHFRSTAQIHCFRWHKSWISNTVQKSSQFSKLSLYSANCFCKQE